MTITNAEVQSITRKIKPRNIRQHYEYFNMKIKRYPDGSIQHIHAPFRVKHRLTAEAKAQLERDKQFNSYSRWNGLNYDYYDETMDNSLNFRSGGDYSDKDKKDSTKRTKDSIMDYSHSNTWTHFVTFTLDSKLVESRYDYDEFASVIGKFKKAFKRRYPDGLALFVPEQHTDGAWHVHGLINADIQSELVNSGKKDKGGRIIYNWLKYNYGFSTVTKVTDSKKAASYMSTYVTKTNEVPKGKKRYWSTENLKKPTSEYQNVDESEIIAIKDNASHSKESTRNIKNYATGEVTPVTYGYYRTNTQTL